MVTMVARSNLTVMRSERMVAGPRIQAYRDALGWSQAELGRRLGVGRQLVSYWESREVVRIEPERVVGLVRLFRQPAIELTDEGRPVDEVAEEVRRGATVVEPLGTGTVQVRDPHERYTIVERIAVYSSRGVIDSQGDIPMWPADLRAAERPVVVEVVAPVRIDGEDYPEGSYILVDTARDWHDGSLHLFRVGANRRLVLTCVHLNGETVSWTDDDGNDQQKPKACLERIGVAYRILPAARELP